MRADKIIMGMPCRVEVAHGGTEACEAVFAYFAEVDARFSTYKEGSEIMRINRGEIKKEDYSGNMREIFSLAEKTKQETGGFFSIMRPDGTIDPSGLVKGWAIYNAALLLERLGHENYFIDLGGDIQSQGLDEQGNPWSIGIRNPFKREEIVKVLHPRGLGVATSGTYIRGQHIYNPLLPGEEIGGIVSLTVVGPNIYEADRFATAAFAMGRPGIRFVEGLPGFEGYLIDSDGIATMTTGFEALTS